MNISLFEITTESLPKITGFGGISPKWRTRIFKEIFVKISMEISFTAEEGQMRVVEYRWAVIRFLSEKTISGGRAGTMPN